MPDSLGGGFQTTAAEGGEDSLWHWLKLQKVFDMSYSYRAHRKSKSKLYSDVCYFNPDLCYKMLHSRHNMSAM